MPNGPVSKRASRAANTATLLDSPTISLGSESFGRGRARVPAVPGAVFVLILAGWRLGAACPAVTPGAQTPAQAGSTDPTSGAGPATTTARLTYTRTLMGSTPEYLAVVVNSDGSGSYEGRRLADDAHPRPLRLSPATTEQLFALAAELNDFRSIELESHKKVADLGLKTFSYERGGEKSQVRFNYTMKQPARELTDVFERIANMEQHVDTLQYALKYDPLSLPEELLRIQIDLEHKALADPELMAPSLEEIAKNPRLLHLAQVRAQDILKTVNGER